MTAQAVPAAINRGFEAVILFARGEPYPKSTHGGEKL